MLQRHKEQLNTKTKPRAAAKPPRKETKMKKDNIAEFKGVKVKIPNGYRLNSEGLYQNGHGVEYALVRYGGTTICLETVYSKHVRTIELEIVAE